MWFSYRGEPGVFIPLKISSVKSILEDNAKGEIPEELIPITQVTEKLVKAEPVFENPVGQDSLTRFDRNKGNKPKSNQRGSRSGNQARPNNRNQTQKPKQPLPDGTRQGKPKPNNKGQAKPQPNNRQRRPQPPKNDNKDAPKK